MKKMWLLIGCLYSSFIMANETPEHFRYQVLVTDPTTSSVTEESFHKIPRTVFNMNYQSFLANKQKVILNLMWETPYFSAWVKEEAPQSYSINFWGGITRIPGMNDNGLALIACHEVGHLLGGEPRSKIPAFIWASSEGQADYYATAICLKNYYELLFATGKLEEPQEIDNVLYTRCRTKYVQEKDFLICLNIMDGIKGFSAVLYHLDPDKKEISFTQKGPKASATNYNSYPMAQCRVETLVAGNFCAKDKYPCLKADSARPQCWFVD